jgi:Undecaprenyl-phosphate glucose phosphotransferase
VYNFFIFTGFIFFRILLFKKLFAYFRSAGKNIRNMAIIGAGQVGENFLEMLKSNPEYGYNFIGFIDHNLSEKNVIGSPEQLDSLIQNYKIEEAVIALPYNDFSLIEEIIRTCNKNAVRAFIIPDYFKFISKKFRISQFGNFPIITVRNEPLEEIQWRFIKRSIDILISVITTVLLLSWLFPVIMLLIKLTSRGPIFYMQDRIGINNKPFRCFKFRTMKINSDGLKFTPTDKDDPRVTPLGRFLRKSNIDELPQVLNVLIGDMSIVGPRPHMMSFNNVYKEVVEEIKLRTLVKPGITGWAQVHGLRGDSVDAEENKLRIKKRIEYDIWYIENWSISLDIQIILLTAWQMLTGKTKGR